MLFLLRLLFCFMPASLQPKGVVICLNLCSPALLPTPTSQTRTPLSQGGPDAPPLTESLTNLAVNATALAVLTFFLIRDLKGKEADVAVTGREEALSRLLIRLSPERQLPLIRFRGVVRPVIVAGDRSYVERAIKAAEPMQAALRARGVSVVPVVYTDDPNAKLRALKKELQQQKPNAKGFGRGGDEGADGEATAELPETAGIGNSESLTEEDRRWRLEPGSVVEWEVRV